MTNIKTRIEFAVQGKLDGGSFYDVSVHRSEAAAEKVLDRILRQCYPQWRGITMGFRLLRRVVSVKTESQVLIFTTTASGKVRSRLAEMFIPTWLPEPMRRKLKERPIP